MTEPLITNTSTFVVPMDHPALAGHFPGNPIVPGVLILEHVIRACESVAPGRTVPGCLRYAKFVAPLLPARTAEVTLVFSDREVTFGVHCDETLIARGAFGNPAATAP